MQPIQINVQVSIGLTRELQALLTSVLTGRAAAPQEVTAESAPAETALAESAPAEKVASREKKVASREDSEPPFSAPVYTPESQGIDPENPKPVPENPKAVPENPEPAPGGPDPAGCDPGERGPLGGEAPAEREYTEVDVREAIERTRRRILGPDYREHRDSEVYRRWYHPLRDWFVNLSNTLGYDKPSALPDHASRAAFIRHCDAVEVQADELVETQAS